MSLDSVTEYALSFSEDAVHLLHREKVPGHRVGWRHIGSVEFASAEFRTELADLRAMATGGAEDQMLPVTLLIPDDQILYTTLTVTPGADRERAVGKALDGLTPYAVEDLAFDWNGDGDSVRVAAVARQTLHEAQGFAARYGFDGHSYRADPRPENFPDEPVFALEMQQKPGRPGIDLSQAGVTSAGLLVGQDEPEAALDLDLQPDAVIAPEDKEELAAAAKIVDMAEDQAALARKAAPADAEGGAVARNLTDDTKNALEAVDSAAVNAAGIAEAKGDDHPAASTQTALGEAAPALEDKAAPEIAATVAPQAGDEAGTAPVSGIAAEGDQTEPPLADGIADAEPSVAAEPKGENAQLPPLAAVDAACADPAIAAEPETDSAELPLAGLSPKAEVTASPVVRHAPAGQGKPLAAPVGPGGKLSARAQAFHKRAAEARQGDAAPAADARMKPVRDGNGLGTLLLMLAVLVVGLFFAWAFLVPGSKAPDAPQDVAEVAPPAAAPSEPVEAPAQIAPVAAHPAAPAATTPAGPASADPVTPVDSTQAETPTAAPMPPASAPPAPASTAEVARTSALTPAEQRRAIVAAAAVAAAVVPPAQTPATVPAPVEPAPVEPAPAPAAQVSTPSRTPAPVAAAPAAPARTAPSQPEVTATPRPATAARATVAPAAKTVPAPAVRLTSSARPMLSPRRTTPVTSTPRADSAPAVPANPLPYEAAQRSVQPKSSARPPARGAQRRAVPVVAPAAPVAVTQGAGLRGSSRPPSRPEGAVPDFDADAALTPQEQLHLDQQLRDLRAVMGVQAQAAAPDAPVRLAQARPTRRPSSLTASDAVSASAVDAALQQAADSPPGRPAASASTAAPARDSGGLLHGASRPRARPSLGGAVASSAVESAVAAAVNASAATPGGVKLSALSGSAHPPRRSAAAAAAAALAATPAAAPDATPAAPETAPAAEAPPLAEQVVAANQGPSEAELAERRRLDEQLQAQAEARIRARAQADAAAEAQARAQAEARARAQAQAEERAAAARRQTYKPPEVDDEPEVVAALPRGGQTSASVARSATQARGIDLGRTTIIGIIGAGNASRALIRLRNGKIVTVRLGDRIDGGTINSIGDGKLTYVKAGQQRELRLLDGR